MIPRGKLDLSFSDTFAGIGYCLAGYFRKNKTAADFPKKEDHMVTLSVRTGVDLILTALNYPPGTEILVSDINIPDMFQIIRAHQLIPIPLSVKKDTLSIDPEALKAAINPASKMLLLSHLFGAVMDMEAIIPIAKAHQILVIEDAAQAFMGNIEGPQFSAMPPYPAFPGHPETDILIYSFGLIKTNTALSGAVVRIKDPSLYLKACSLNEGLRRQKTSVYLKKLLKVLFMQLLTTPIGYTLFYHLITRSGRDFDDALAGFTSGFPGQDVLRKIRFRPCTANHRLLKRRWINFSPDGISERRKLAAAILSRLPEAMKIGTLNKNHSYWVLPIYSAHPDELIKHLRSHGFDATAKASSLIKLESQTPVNYLCSTLDLAHIIYLPMDIQMKNSKREEISSLLLNFP
ncbi:aminotransferase class I/II-fold pyridoxal phosphate-dependent enzyme [Pedobacter gandavensis]|uniref:aminotransferase class I/II-fold pyridoxal phosphate-dependent enzyme n=1 Tax=Pedobacter gandavensis TaxID=2679963 RepID=UPI00247AF2B7|nr:aminotransferase class I/II-fold pyridoxal phosphate-dependent enzyme [Pedobacter gandavensis]WGQ09588.1 aminotransferase class I/II-fold pyridoxal phosphate-dependent enzyme [Pedobacter gandavensis]